MNMVVINIHRKVFAVRVHNIQVASFFGEHSLRAIFKLFMVRGVFLHIAKSYGIHYNNLSAIAVTISAD